jgi:hypothetical protein
MYIINKKAVGTSVSFIFRWLVYFTLIIDYDLFFNIVSHQDFYDNTVGSSS